MKSKKAFTLIELLVVIAIIGILATISVLALSNARAKSRDAKRVGDMKQVQTALELFFNDKNRYPTAEEWATGQIYSTTTESTSTYMQIIPAAVGPADGTCTNNQNTISYTPTEAGASYAISFCLGGNTGTLNSGPKCLTPGGIIDVNCSGIESCNPVCQIGYNCEDSSCVYDQPQADIRASLNPIVASSDLSKMFAVNSADGYFYSSGDSGETWARGVAIPAGLSSLKLAASSDLNNLALASRNNNIYTSVDSGVT
ncbi:hypothetical protein COT98_01485 [Candidatus Falkowbacteria bacterium CG10_big_fil_rev_8_21_14_0_10_39_9]|uniref:Type II secretion system protein GspG C-terminal domain-containing protein n=1 Tax=Candidatus Falkowbacteria bacterium CG10_big_fil_rev_8_21_14_0_10_39_9 TaxID=1974566 RepID=A0A2M6WQJ3_9BACT|nr:MAG: hypothetical protein COT98_01485 [Candidatus Falkowbacteria bacterium CG10_big_fil_rev_8_21_14_0_10_39_9]